MAQVNVVAHGWQSESLVQVKLVINSCWQSSSCQFMLVSIFLVSCWLSKIVKLKSFYDEVVVTRAIMRTKKGDANEEPSGGAGSMGE